METPAFLCEGFSVMVGMKDIVDFEQGTEFGDGASLSGFDRRRKSVKAIKFAMEHMEAKPTTTKVHFSLNINTGIENLNFEVELNQIKTTIFIIGIVQ